MAGGYAAGLLEGSGRLWARARPKAATHGTQDQPREQGAVTKAGLEVLREREQQREGKEASGRLLRPAWPLSLS